MGVGKDLRCLEGPATERASINEVVKSCRTGTPVFIPAITNYDRNGRPFSHAISVTPLPSPDGTVRIFRVTSHAINAMCSGGDDRLLADLTSLMSLKGTVPRSLADSTMVVLTAPTPPYPITWASPGWL